MRWNPWQELRRRGHIELVWAEIPGGTRGAWFDFGDRRVIVLDHRLDRRQRRATLAHELVHDERGLPLLRALPASLRAKEEALVERITAERLVPVDELRTFAQARAELGPVMVSDVAEEFDVPEHVARVACELVR